MREQECVHASACAHVRVPVAGATSMAVDWAVSPPAQLAGDTGLGAGPRPAGHCCSGWGDSGRSCPGTCSGRRPGLRRLSHHPRPGRQRTPDPAVSRPASWLLDRRKEWGQREGGAVNHSSAAALASRPPGLPPRAARPLSGFLGFLPRTPPCGWQSRVTLTSSPPPLITVARCPPRRGWLAVGRTDRQALRSHPPTPQLQERLPVLSSIQ